MDFELLDKTLHIRLMAKYIRPNSCTLLNVQNVHTKTINNQTIQLCLCEGVYGYMYVFMCKLEIVMHFRWNTNKKFTDKERCGFSMSRCYYQYICIITKVTIPIPTLYFQTHFEVEIEMLPMETLECISKLTYYIRAIY